MLTSRHVAIASPAWRMMVALTAVLAFSGCSALSIVANAAATVSTSTTLLYVGHGVGVVATVDPRTDCSEVFLTSNFHQWRNITPPLGKLGSQGSCVYAWSDASFTSPDDGWLLARDGASPATILRHTLNGGRTWSSQPGGSSGSNGGFETINFVTPRIGWRQQFGTGSNGAYSLQRTLDGGSTWSTRSADPLGSCALAETIFSSATEGFASSSARGVDNPTFLLRTSDGGVTCVNAHPKQPHVRIETSHTWLMCKSASGTWSTPLSLRTFWFGTAWWRPEVGNFLPSSR